MNNKGLTLVEFVVAAGLMVLFLALTGSLILDINKLNSMSSKELENQSQIILTQLQLSNLLPSFGPSFNLLVGIKDDLNREFFEYYPNSPDSDFSESELQRVFTLDQVGEEIIFIYEDKRFNQFQHYSPLSAFAPLTTPLSPTANIPLTPNGFNKHKEILSWSKVIESNGLYLVKSPVYLIQSSGSPKPFSFIGRPQANDNLLKENLSFTFTKNPKVNPPIEWQSIHDLLTNLPPVGGQNTFVTVDPILISRLRVIAATQDSKSTGETKNLVIEQYIPGTATSWTEPRVVLPNLISLKFIRKKVNSMMTTAEAKVRSE